jgi:hypothetical protein
LLVADGFDERFEWGLAVIWLEQARAGTGHDTSEEFVAFAEMFESFLVHREQSGASAVAENSDLPCSRKPNPEPSWTRQWRIVAVAPGLSSSKLLSVNTKCFEANPLVISLSLNVRR